MTIVEIYDKQVGDKERVEAEIQAITEALKEVNGNISLEVKKGIDEPKKLIKRQRKLKNELSELEELKERLSFAFTLDEVKAEMLSFEGDIMKSFYEEKLHQEQLQKEFIERLKESAQKQNEYLKQISVNKSNYSRIKEALGYTELIPDFNYNFANSHTARFFADCSKYI